MLNRRSLCDSACFSSFGETATILCCVLKTGSTLNDPVTACSCGSRLDAVRLQASSLGQYYDLSAFYYLLVASLCSRETNLPVCVGMLCPGQPSTDAVVYCLGLCFRHNGSSSLQPQSPKLTQLHRRDVYTWKQSHAPLKIQDEHFLTFLASKGLARLDCSSNFTEGHGHPLRLRLQAFLRSELSPVMCAEIDMMPMLAG